ncbi:hypothetical protein [Larsenimonas suaedae]|uniref:Uncharacterized protein n=1 Tax=Larsenimonas suaedae TaxID=1851019 RepID=A0ABU1GRZ7_9GAMM|nr:hypothetical protein [Larsenimonas suaedae]MCM2972401.1 hypothetical protein [Larsenimonas suaedae]MDR5894803.1 hypothetical protein [Larsenimonas suaedae]
MNTFTYATFIGAIVLLLGYLVSGDALGAYAFLDWPTATRWQVIALSGTAFVCSLITLALSTKRRNLRVRHHRHHQDH